MRGYAASWRVAAPWDTRQVVRVSSNAIRHASSGRARVLRPPSQCMGSGSLAGRRSPSLTAQLWSAHGVAWAPRPMGARLSGSQHSTLG